MSDTPEGLARGKALKDQLRGLTATKPEAMTAQTTQFTAEEFEHNASALLSIANHGVIDEGAPEIMGSCVSMLRHAAAMARELETLKTENKRLRDWADEAKGILT